MEIENGKSTRPRHRVAVSKLDGGQYQTIAAAIEAVQPGTRIIVRPGVYNEGFIVDRHVEIVGDGNVEDVVIESKYSNLMWSHADYAKICGLTLRSSVSVQQDFYAINIDEGGLVLEDCDITSDSFHGFPSFCS